VVTVHGGLLKLSTPGRGEIVDLTDGVAAVVSRSQVRHGVATVFAVGSTVAVTTMEYEPGAVADLRAALERLLPAGLEYEHNRLNHDTNAHAHLRAALIGPSETIPVIDGRLALGTWQQLVLLDLDTRPRERTVHVTILA
jgi:secondary thiamine-phosphate synthase enzyme